MSTWVKLAKCSQDSAHRDIAELVRRSILTKDNADDRSASDSLAKPEDQRSLLSRCTQPSGKASAIMPCPPGKSVSRPRPSARASIRPTGIWT